MSHKFFFLKKVMSHKLKIAIIDDFKSSLYVEDFSFFFWIEILWFFRYSLLVSCCSFFEYTCYIYSIKVRPTLPLVNLGYLPNNQWEQGP
jgi:hypothetical protein